MKAGRSGDSLTGFAQLFSEKAVARMNITALVVSSIGAIFLNVFVRTRWWIDRRHILLRVIAICCSDVQLKEQENDESERRPYTDLRLL